MTPHLIWVNYISLLRHNSKTFNFFYHISPGQTGCEPCPKNQQHQKQEEQTPRWSWTEWATPTKFPHMLWHQTGNLHAGKFRRKTPYFLSWFSFLMPQWWLHMEQAVALLLSHGAVASIATHNQCEAKKSPELCSSTKQQILWIASITVSELFQ